MTVDLDHVSANSYMADALFAYVPEHKMIIEGDIATAAEDLQWGETAGWTTSDTGSSRSSEMCPST